MRLNFNCTKQNKISLQVENKRKRFSICGDKPRIMILNRMDLADPVATKKWLAYFRQKGMAAVAADCKHRKGISEFQPAVRSVLKEKIERNAAKGMNIRFISKRKLFHQK